MKRKIIVLAPFVLLIVGFFLMRTLMSLRQEEPKREAPVRPKIVDTEVVQLGDIPSSLVAFGRIASTQPVTLISEVSGTLIEGDIPFQPGQSFRKGDLLIKVDDRQMRFELNSTKSDLMTALATVLPEFKVDFPGEFQAWQDYFNSISFDKPLQPLPEVENQKIKLFLARFNVYKLYFAARNLEIRLEKHEFRAPFNGSIVSTQLRAGSTASPGTRLGEIINLDKLEVQVPMPAKDVAWISRTKPVRLTSEEVPGEWSGRINRIGNAIDDRTQTVPAFISINKNGSRALFEGSFVRAEIAGETIQDAIAIPRKAIYEDKFVYLIKAGKFEYKAVNITFEGADSYIVRGGLSNGDTLVVELLQGVAPGMPAQAKEAVLTEQENDSALAERSGP